MTTKATEKIIDALAQLVEGFAELQANIEEEFDPDRDVDEDEKVSDDKAGDAPLDVDEALVTEVRAALEAVIENEDCAPEDLASVISALTDALEEIDPEVFAHETEEASDEDETVKYDDDDDDIDLDDEDEDYDDDEDEDEEEEDEDDDDDDDDDDDIELDDDEEEEEDDDD